VFEFRGAARERRMSEKEQLHDSDWGYDAARNMNDRGGEIADSIRAELKRSLPPGAEVFVEIEYFPGSLEWLGVVTVMEWAARIADNISFVEYVVKAIRAVVNRVNRRYLRRWGGPGPDWHRRMEFETEVHQVAGGLRAARALPAVPAISPDVRVLLYLNTVLLILVLALLAFKLLPDPLP
jgi:hypothetical protein